MPRDLTTWSQLASEDWTITTISMLTGGVNNSKPAYDISDEEWSDAKNIVARDGIAVLDTGYRIGAWDPWAAPDTRQLVRGTPRLETEHLTASGIRTAILITNLAVYRLASGANGDYWELVSGGAVSTTLATAALTGGEASFDVASSAGMAVDDVIGVTDDSGDTYSTVITNIAANTISVSPSIPAGFTAAIGNDVYLSCNGHLNGVDTDQVDWTFVPGNFWLVFTNNVDVVMKYDGVNALPLGGLSAINLTRAKTVNYFENCLILGNVTVSGGQLPFAVYWSNGPDVETWTTGGSSIAGFENLLKDSREAIVNMSNLGDVAIIYREKGAVRQELVDTTERLFNFRTILPAGGDQGGVGPLSVHSVISLSDRHVFMSKDGIFEYRGGFNLIRLSKAIDKTVFSETGLLNREVSDRSIAQYLDNRNELLFIYPKSGETYPRQAVIYDPEERVFTNREFSHAISGPGVRLASAAFLISDLVGTMGEQTWTARTAGISGENALIVLCSADDNLAYLYDYIVSLEDGNEIDWRLETKEFRGDGFFVRFDFHYFLLGGSTITIEYSVDGGSSWVAMGTVSPGPLTLVKLAPPGQQFVSDSVMYALSGTGGAPRIARIAALTRSDALWTD